MKYVPGNSQHIGSRQEQQDSFGFSDPEDLEFAAHGGFLAILADGAGGMEQGAAASRVAVRAFLDGYRQKPEHETIPAALHSCLNDANQAVRAVAEQANAAENVATTLVAAVLCRKKLYWISVGDSALYLYRNASLSPLSHSHTFARELDRDASLGRISREAALNHPDREALTSYVGISTLREVDENPAPVELHFGDKILLASDGLFKTLSDVEIAAELELTAQECCDSLIEKTLEKNRDHQDNVTVLCIAVEAEDKENSAPNELADAPHGAETLRNLWAKFFDYLRSGREKRP